MNGCFCRLEQAFAIRETARICYTIRKFLASKFYDTNEKCRMQENTDQKTPNKDTFYAV